MQTVIIASLAFIIQLIGVSLYIRSMMRGEAKPNRVSWAIWALGPIIGVWLQWKVESGLYLLPVFMAGFNPIIVVVASFLIKKGYWEIKKFDVYCGILAILSLFLWATTQNLFLSIAFAIASDLLAGIPTLYKSWKYPESENPSAYIGGGIANILGLSIIKDYNFSTLSFGLYLVILNVVIVLGIYRKKIFKIA